MKTEVPLTKQSLTTGDIALICEVAPRTVSKWIDGGVLKGKKLPMSNDRRVERSDLIAFMVTSNFSHRLVAKATGLLTDEFIASLGFEKSGDVKDGVQLWVKDVWRLAVSRDQVARLNGVLWEVRTAYGLACLLQAANAL